MSLYNYINDHLYKPALIIILRLILWGFSWVMREDDVEEGYEIVSKYYGRQYRLDERTAALMGHLQPDQQEAVFNMAWELRKCEREVSNCIDQAKTTAQPLQSQYPSQPPE
jgi:hypothetical protein